MSLLKNIKEKATIKQLLFEKGLSIEQAEGWMEFLPELKHWYNRNKKEFFIDCLNKGIKNINLAKLCYEANQAGKENVVDEVLRVKEGLIKEGLKEDDAEKWAMVFLSQNKLFTFLRSRGLNDLEVAMKLKEDKYLDSSFFKQVDNLLKVCRKHIEEKYALKEVKYFILNAGLEFSFGNRFKTQGNIKSMFLQAQENGFKSLVLWYSFLVFKSKYPDLVQKGLSYLKERKNFYLSFGLDEVVAEWWASMELSASKGFTVMRQLDEKYRKTIMLVDEPYHIYKLFSITSEHGQRQTPENFYRLARLLKENLIEYKDLHELDIEEVKKWKSTGLPYYSVAGMLKNNISPEEFHSLLQESYCSAWELSSMIKSVGLEQTKLWFSVGVKDYETFEKLKSLDYEIVKGFVNFFGFEELVKTFEEEGPEAVKKKYGEKNAQIRAVKLFKRK